MSQLPQLLLNRARSCVLPTILSLCAVTQGRAQLTSPELTTFSAAAATRPISAAEAAHHVWIKDGRLKDAGALLHTPDYPRDSMRKALTAAGAEWLTRMQRAPIHGIQLDASGRVGITAAQEAYAKHQIAERLATPGLSFQDRAFAYMTAVQAFADVDYPERLPQAETYLKQLDALGDSAAYWQYFARAHLIYTYYLLGQSADVIRHGMRAFELAPLMPFISRHALIDDHMYPVIVEALAGQPRGADRIAALNTAVLAALTPSQALMAQDSGYVEMATREMPWAKSVIAVHALLGTPGHPLIAQLWINRPKSDSTTIAVNDGKIRIVEVSDYRCKACLECLDRMERLHLEFPNIEVMLLTTTSGYWENRLLSPQEEGKALSDYFVNYRKLTFPIGVWLSKKAVNREGGLTPESSGPNEVAYRHVARPTFWVLDGKGMIRRIVQGQSDDMEAQLARTVTFLLREANGSVTIPTSH